MDNVLTLLAWDPALIVATYKYPKDSPFTAVLKGRYTDTLIALLELGARPSSLYNMLKTYMHKYKDSNFFLYALVTPNLQMKQL